MRPFYFKVHTDFALMAVPDADAHMDGHPVLTYSYALYRDISSDGNHFTDTDSLLTPDKKKDPNYLGTLTFEQPGRVFSYEADGPEELPAGAIQEVIEQITHYRENPNSWLV